MQAVASFGVLLATLPLAHYLRALDVAVLVLLVPALALMAAILLAQVFEFAEVFWDGSLRRRAAPRPCRRRACRRPSSASTWPAATSRPTMVIATIDSLLALDWPAFEVVVVDNNTSDPARWRPVQAHVRRACRRVR